MKHALYLFVLLLLAGCKKKEEALPEELTPGANENAAPSKQCYLYVNVRDTIKLTIQESHNHASGRLQFKNFEKDSSDGTLSGTFLGDTLFADYTFRSEGMMSVRQMAFLRQKGTLIVGTGELEEVGNKQVFKDAQNISFQSNIILRRVGCE